jgi:hypothetical protein
MRTLPQLPFVAAMLCVLAARGGAPLPAGATNAPAAALEAPSLQDRLHFDCRVTWRGYPELIELDDATAGLLPAPLLPPGRAGVSDLRADLRAAPTDFLELEIKPRYRVAYETWRQGVRDGDGDWNNAVFVNGWLVQTRLWNQLALAYSREDMQWGPSYLTSPSNPFRSDNGRNLPQVELPGMDFVKAVWTPSTHYSVSALANVDDGRANPPPLAALGAPAAVRDAVAFNRTYALKADYTGRGCTVSAVGSVRETSGPRGGAYASWNASDAVLLYGEAGGNNHGDADYLLGASYTFLNGGALAAEYLHNDLASGDAAVRLASLFATSGPGMGFFRQDYTLLQYTQRELLGRLDVVARWIHGLNDGGDRLAGEVECAVDDHISLFADGIVDLGTRDQEFGLYLHYLALAGIKVSL